MVSRSKPSLEARVRPPSRVVTAIPRRGFDDAAVTYAVSVMIAVAAMVMAAMAGGLNAAL